MAALADPSAFSPFVDRLERVLSNRQVVSAIKKLYLSSNEPHSLEFIKFVVEKLVAADFNSRPQLSRLTKLATFEISDVVEQRQFLMDNEAVALLMHDIDRNWWQKPALNELVTTVLFVNRLLGVGCQLRYPLLHRVFFYIKIVTESGEEIIGPYVDLIK